MRWLKHAFAVEADAPAEPNAAQRAIVERLCAEVVRRQMTTPALAFLEMSRPLNYLGAQTMHFFGPLVTAIANADSYRELAAFLEQRASIDYICRRIEALEAERDRAPSQYPDQTAT